MTEFKKPDFYKNVNTSASINISAIHIMNCEICKYSNELEKVKLDGLPKNINENVRDVGRQDSNIVVHMEIS